MRSTSVRNIAFGRQNARDDITSAELSTNAPTLEAGRVRTAPTRDNGAMSFELYSHSLPPGDQPQAIKKLVDGLTSGLAHQTLLGVTGSGKTFTIANVIQQVQRPTLVLAHNKTLAAQLYGEFREFFPNNAVEYFVSYYDYYQPEAYIAHTDTYIAKDSSINDEIARLRHSATQSLLTRPDTLIVASVSCIYGLGSPAGYIAMARR